MAGCEGRELDARLEQPARDHARSLSARARIAFAIATTACGSGSADTAQIKRAQPTVAPTTTLPAPPTTTVPPYITYIVTVRPEVTNLAVYPAPGATEPSMYFPNPWLYEPDNPATAVPQVFMAKTLRGDEWVEVLLPVRPNGSLGWLHASDVTILRNPFHIMVSLSAHTITVTNATTVIYTGPVAVGAPETPTPTGRYYLYVLLESPDPSGPYGPFAYGLSSHSDALATFSGGDAEIGIHGNADASVLGSSVSHGCIRMDNGAITELSKQLPLGTPVEITA